MDSPQGKKKSLNDFFNAPPTLKVNLSQGVQNILKDRLLRLMALH